MRLLLVIVLLIPALAFSQRTFLFRNYTLENGLSQSVVTSIQQDESYALWIGTQDGLNRFDGHTFENFSTTNNDNIPNDYIKTVFKAKDKKIWFGTQDGIFNYNPYQETFTKINHRLPSTLQIESLLEDKNGRIWIGSYNNGILYIDKNDTKVTPFISGEIIKNITSIFQLSGKELGVIASGNLYRIDIASKRLRKENILPDKEITAVQCITQQQLLLGTNKGLYQLDMSSMNVSELGNGEIKTNEITSLSFDDYYYFVGTASNGLFVIGRNNHEITHSQKDRLNKNALPDNTINTIFKDKSNVIWVGSNYGLSNFNIYQNDFHLISTSEYALQGLPSPNVWCFEENNDGRIIFVGTDNYVSFFNRTADEFTHCPLEITEKGKKIPVKDASISSIEYVSEDLVLVATTNGLFKLYYNGGKPFFEKIKITGARNEIDANRIYMVTHWKGDDYFLGTKDGVIKFNLKSKQFEFFYHNPKDKSGSIPAGICRSIFKDETGRIHFFTSEGGMCTYSEYDNKIKPSVYNSLLLKETKDYITSALQIGSDFWFGTLGGGLIKLNTETKKTAHFNHKNGLPNNVIYGILKDKENDIWMSTNKGLLKLNTRTGKFISYKDYGGFLVSEFNQGAFLKAKSGELFFGGINGYNFFNPEDIRKKERNTNISIISLKISNEPVFPGKESVISEAINFVKELRLTHRQNNISFRIMAEDLGNSNLARYKYILEGENKDEVKLENQNVIHFSNLQPGDYTLKIYAKMGDSDWSIHPKTIHLKIKAPFWKTAWFWILISVTGTIATLIYVRIKIELSRREQVILEMKIAERTKELRRQGLEIEKQGKIIEEKNKRLELQKELLEEEKSKTDKLLKNILPESTFNELKESGKVTARSYEKVSVMFTDFVGFTKISENLAPAEIVTQLDVYFTEFDSIIVKNNLEKIKTIGDAYMCAGGIPVRNRTNPIDTCLAALEIQDFMQKKQAEQQKENKHVWKLRLGINTGDITAGVIGKKKLAYDIWGSTVNKASRMEMVGEPDEVTISGATYEHIQFYFDCEFKGKVLSKGNEELDIYTVNRIKKELSADEAGIVPNEKFWKLVNLHLYSQINYGKAEKHVIELLQKQLSPHLHYHSLEHTFDVVSAVERIALEEGITDENLFLLKTAALFHDAGFVEQYEKNESIGVRMAEEILPDYGYSPEQISIIRQLIFVTQIPHKPTCLMEEIMCDADLDYLGRSDFFEIGDRLRRELRENNKINSDRNWDETQIKFLTQHRYFTKTSINTRVEQKKKHLEMIKNRLDIYPYKD